MGAGLATATATVAVAGLLGALTWFDWRRPLVFVLGLGAVLAIVRWIQWIAHRDARAVIALWVVFAVNRSIALLVPASLGNSVLSLDDAALAVTLAVLTLTGIRLRPPSRELAVAYVGFGVFTACGVAGALVTGLAPRAALLGTWLALKLFACVLVTMQFRWRDRDVRVAARTVGTLIVIAVGTAVAQWVSPATVNGIFGQPERTRLGANVITSIFRQPAQYSTFMIFALAVVLARYPMTARRAGGALLLGAGALFSLRLKALFDIVLMVGARVAVSPARNVKARLPLVLLSAGAAATFLGAGLLRERLWVLFGVDSESARQILYATGALIARDNFPLGGGFGSFGSEASVVVYSPLYAVYGLSNIFGFSVDRPIFVHDAAWATVLGEAGVFGVAGFAVALGALLLAAWRAVRRGDLGWRGDAARAALLFTLAFTSDSLTTPQLFGGFACMTLASLLSISGAGTEPHISEARRADAPGRPEAVWR